MRARVVTLLSTGAFVAASALMGLAAPGGAQEVTAADCGSTTYRLLFWPEGHGTLKTVPHPATDLPHLDVYSGKGKKFLESQNVAYADGTTVTTNATCTPAQPSGSGSATLKNTTQTKQLVCKFTSKPVFIAVPASTVEAPSLSAVVNGALMVSAELGEPGNSSSLGYNAKACKLTKAPK